MRYVAFDIECSIVIPCYSEMCEFGYVIADENFNIITERNLRIKPKKVQRIIGEKIGIKLEDFKDCPQFEEVYEEIREVLEHPDQIIFAHSAISDLKYLGRECRIKRCNYPRIEVYDTEKIYKEYTHSEKTSLESTKEWIGIDFKNHSAIDDSKACLYIMKKIAEEEKENFPVFFSEIPKENVRNSGEADRLLDLEEERSKLERLYNPKFRNIRVKGKNADGIVVCFANDTAKKSPREAKTLAYLILENSGDLSRGMDGADVQIVNKDMIPAIYRVRCGRDGDVVSMTLKEMTTALRNNTVRQEMQRFREEWEKVSNDHSSRHKPN